MNLLMLALIVLGGILVLWMVASALPLLRRSRPGAANPYRRDVSSPRDREMPRPSRAPSAPTTGTPDASPAAGRIAYIRGYQFDASVSRSLGEQYPLTASQIEQVLAGLRQWFEVCLRCDLQAVWMPSKVVDVAWHAFICSTRNYREFCTQAFGRFLDHQPAEVMGPADELPDSKRRTWIAACACAGLDHSNAASMPLLFSLDDQLAIRDGFRYRSGTMPQDTRQSLAPMTSCSGTSGFLMPLLMTEMMSSSFSHHESMVPMAPLAAAPAGDSSLTDSRKRPADAAGGGTYGANAPGCSGGDGGAGCGGNGSSDGGASGHGGSHSAGGSSSSCGGGGSSSDGSSSSSCSGGGSSCGGGGSSCGGGGSSCGGGST